MAKPRGFWQGNLASTRLTGFITPALPKAFFIGGFMIIQLCGYDVLIDDEDYDRIMSRKWNHRHSYDLVYFSSYNMRVNGVCKHDQLHRFLIGVKFDQKIVVDHINGNTLDLRKSNLRICSQKQNSKNAKLGKNNTSGYKGVSRHQNTNKFRAFIVVDNKQKHLGYFKCPTKAWFAYVNAAKVLHGEFARFK